MNIISFFLKNKKIINLHWANLVELNDNDKVGEFDSLFESEEIFKNKKI